MSPAVLTPVDPVAQVPGRVHLIFPHGSRTAAPDSIGRELGRRLERRYKVIYYEWSFKGVIDPKPGDILIGHPHPDPKTVFRRSLGRPGWRRRLMLAPFNHGDMRQIAFEDSVLPGCDLFLAITGPHWFRTIGESRCSHWQPKMRHLDMAVVRADYPPIKSSFSPPGRRRVLYIGHSGRGKNTPYLSKIAALLPDIEFAWVGRGARPIDGLKALGFIDYDSIAGREILAGYDIFLTVGNANSNPTTILEAMSWGMIPVCTPTSGYSGIESIVNVPVDDAEVAAEVLSGLISADESDLRAIQATNWRLLGQHYTWDRFADQVLDAIESAESPPLLPESPRRRLHFAYWEMTSPYSRIRYGWPRLFMWGARQALSRLRRSLRHFRAGRTR